MFSMFVDWITDACWFVIDGSLFTPSTISNRSEEDSSAPVSSFIFMVLLYQVF